MDLNKIVNEVPNINLTISAGDLRDFATQLIDQTREDLEDTIVRGRTDSLITTEEAMNKLRVCKTTLWRWKKRDYLRPVRVGGNERYRLSDINKILKGDDCE